MDLNDPISLQSAVSGCLMYVNMPSISHVGPMDDPRVVLLKYQQLNNIPIDEVMSTH